MPLDAVQWEPPGEGFPQTPFLRFGEKGDFAALICKFKAAELTPRPFLPFAFYRCQIFSAYSRIARSAAKMPLSAMFTRLMRANSPLFEAVAYSLSWQAT